MELVLNAMAEISGKRVSLSIFSAGETICRPFVASCVFYCGVAKQCFVTQLMQF